MVYIMAGESRTLYIGVTRDLLRRVVQHRCPPLPQAFSARYRTRKLVYFEASDNIAASIAREKQLKSWRRERKLALIEQHNPAWDDLARDWLQDGP